MQLRVGASRRVALIASFAALACSQPPQPGERNTRSVGSVINREPRDSAAHPRPDSAASQALPALVRLEQEARAIARTEGCRDAEGCRTAPVGWRGCGGPRTYLVYCAATTDTAALFRKLAELEAAERAYNASSGMMSTCELRMPPAVRLDGGSCRERSRGP